MNVNKLKFRIVTVFLFLGLGMYSQWDEQFSSEQLNQSLTTGNILTYEAAELPNTTIKDVNPYTYVDLKLKDMVGNSLWFTIKLKLEITPLLASGAIDTESKEVSLQLDSNYLSGAGGSFIDVNKYVLDNRYGANIKVVEVKFTDNSSGGAEEINVPIPDNVELTVGFSAERYHNLEYQDVPSLNPALLEESTNELEISWNEVKGALGYDVEWTWVDSYTKEFNTSYDANKINFSDRDFELNNSRIQTIDTRYNISALHRKGFLIYRVRAVGRYFEDVSKYKYSNWSSGSTLKTKVSDWPHYYEITAEESHHTLKNWQFQASYAEEGKKKEVVSYFDGSLRNRQTVTKINSDNHAVVGEVIYDAQGRPAIEVLPVPVNNTKIDYVSDFNTIEDSNGALLPYSYQDFDTDTKVSLNQVLTESMSDKTGASKYYSPNNDIEGFFKERIAQASGKPFSQIEYTNDNTGRIKRKGGVGVTHQLGSKHEMKYYYSTPKQKELNRLFGYNVGNELRYKKNIVIDPNGQVSASYIDPQGRTIATALAGADPLSLEPLKDEADLELHKEITFNLFESAESNRLFSTSENGNLNDARLYTSQQMNLVDNTSFYFDYQFTINDLLFNYGCLDGATEGFPFAYDLQLNILHEQGNNLITPVHETFIANNNLSLYTLGNPDGTVENVALGSFGIFKLLKVNKDKLEEYTAQYIAAITDENNPECYVDPSGFAPEASLEGCFVSCEDCKANLLTSEDGVLLSVNEAIDDYVDTQMAPYVDSDSDEINALVERFRREWNLLYLACDEPCKEDGIGDSDPSEEELNVITNSISCENDVANLIQDMELSGQYGMQFTVEDEDAQNTDTLDALSIFNEENSLISAIDKSWRNPKHYVYDIATDQGHYYDENGLISYVLAKDLDDGTYDPPILDDSPIMDASQEGYVKVEPQYLDLENIKDVSRYWLNSWAESLLIYHPEYTYLEYSLAVCGITSRVATATMNSDGYNNFLNTLTTYNSATNTSFNILSTETVLVDNDPYFSETLTGIEHSNSAYTNRVNLMKYALNTDYDNFGVPMLQVVYNTAVCNSISDCDSNVESFSSLRSAIASLDPVDRDKVVQTYVSYYLMLKQRVQYVYTTLYAYNQGFYNGCIGDGEVASSIVSVILDYPQSSTINGFFSKPSESLCDAAGNEFYDDKIKRFKPIDNLYDSQQSPEDAIEELALQVNYEYFIETGVCPLARDMQFYLDGLFSKTRSDGTPAPIVGDLGNYSGQYLTKDLFTDLGGNLPIGNFTISGTPQGNILSITIDGGTPVDLSLPQGSGYSWSGYASSWYIDTISNLYYTGNYNATTGVFDFQVLAKIRSTNVSDTSFEELVLTGQTQARIGECSINNSGNTIGQDLGSGATGTAETNDCDILPSFKSAFVTLFNELIQTGAIGTADYDISQLSAYRNGYLPEYFEVPRTSAAYWNMEGNIITISTDTDTLLTYILDQSVSFTASDKILGLFVGKTINKISGLYSEANLSYYDSSFERQRITGRLFKEGRTLLNFSCCGIQDNPGDPTDDGGNTDDFQSCEEGAVTLKQEVAYHFKNLMNALLDNGEFFNANVSMSNYPDYNEFIQNFLQANAIRHCNQTNLDCPNSEADYFDVNKVFWSFDYQGGDYNLLRFQYDDKHRIHIELKKESFPVNLGTVQKIKFNDENLPTVGSSSFLIEYLEPNGNQVKEILGESFGSQFNFGQQSSGSYYGASYYLCDLFDSIQDETTTIACEQGAALEKRFEGHYKEIFNNIFQNMNTTLGFQELESYESTNNLLNDEIIQIHERINNIVEEDGRYTYDPLILMNKGFYYFNPNNTSSGLSISIGDITSADRPDLLYLINFTLKVYNDNGIHFTTEQIEEIGEIVSIDITKDINFAVECSLRYLEKNNNVIKKVPARLSFYIAQRTTVPNQLSSMSGEFCNDLFQPLANQNLEALSKSSFNKTLVKNENSCDICIPPVIQPISCTEKFPLLQSVATGITGYTLPDLYTIDYFCDMKYAYAVDDYKDYIESLSVTDIESLQFMTVAEFAASGINIGGSSTSRIIDAYAAHVLQEGENAKDWAVFVQEYKDTNPLPCEASILLSLPNAPVIIDDPQTDCEEFILNVSELYNEDSYQNFLDAKRIEFQKAYITAALENVNEDFSMRYFDKEYQYTLYYYDQAGNLKQTVPPEGVDRFTEEKLEDQGIHEAINTYRNSNTAIENETLLPKHELITKYRYNSLNQLIWQNTPDGGTTVFAYDDLGRIIASQNAKQKEQNTFSYTTYDELGRIVEAGELLANTAIYIDDTSGKFLYTNTNDEVDVRLEQGYPVNISNTQKEVTRSVYSQPVANAQEVFNTTTDHIQNSRNRVTAIYYFDQRPNGTLISQYDHAIFYAYDIHGNVKELAQHNREMSIDQNDPLSQIKRTEYEYDLISGNVHKVIYQKGELDQFIHQYAYDADNRIVHVKTSGDGMIWEQDATYQYFAHGPLARIELGNKKVQGIDYAYTLHGWLKGVNSENLTPDNDMGGDGVASSTVAKDAMGYSLSYYQDDYAGIGASTANAFTTGTTVALQSIDNLYNGNIKQMITSLLDNDESMLDTQLNHYQYDQLNRIKTMQGRAVNGVTTKDNYSADYSYDKNGNLLTLNRKTVDKQGDVQDMDQLSYVYKTIPDPVTGELKRSNQLDHVNDAIGNAGFNDLDDQQANNYQYDAIGQLTSDEAEGITDIQWRVDGKVKKITKTDGSIINFAYDGLGNRISKTVLPENKTTYYARDAQGNVMAVYTDTQDATNNTRDLRLEEHHIYGSSRLGLEAKKRAITDAVVTTDTYTSEVGDKRYELSNHLGNVLSVVSDRKVVETTYLSEVSAFEFTGWQNLDEDNNWNRFGPSEVVTTQDKLQITVDDKSEGVIHTMLTEPGKTYTVAYDLELQNAPNINIQAESFGTVLSSTTDTNSGSHSISFTATQVVTNVSWARSRDKDEVIDTFAIDNVTITTSGTLADNTTESSTFIPDVLAFNDYYPFGMLLPNRHGSSSDYRYGFNGMEGDDEVKGEGNSYNTFFRRYDPRIGRWLSIDPKSKEMPFETPYSFANNMPVFGSDIDGDICPPCLVLLYYLATAEGITLATMTGVVSVSVYQNRQQIADGGANLSYAMADLISNTASSIAPGSITVMPSPGLQVETFPTITEALKHQLVEKVLPVKDQIPPVRGGMDLLPLTLSAATIETIPIFNGEDFGFGSLFHELAKVLGGDAYGRLSNLKGPDGKNITELNHLPSKHAYKLAGLIMTAYSGTAHIMDKIDHRNYVTTGSSRESQSFRQAEALLLATGQFMEAFDLNVEAIREAYGNKYDKSLEEARTHYENEVIPKLKKQLESIKSVD
ncbi:RHS repeat-associated core domain-containing protein [uncultured Aquimarina sp.]|uniref:DUF6443 domain-containing protein n=1 Tax=uncultured Aquimarina sp. TaxID=575652 RepID=UPI00263121AB|nr:RHS repeat-associated core domain-containing protein [uncultured Aquimarina sp.]